MNVFEFSGLLVSPISNSKVITQKGAILSANKSMLKPAKLMTGGVYNEKFIQAAVGGLKGLPIKSGKLVAFEGFTSVAYVEPQAAGVVKFAIGLPNEAFGGGADKLDAMKINKDKAADPEKGKAAMSEIDQLDSMGNGAKQGPDILKIDDSEGVGGIRKLVLEWTSGIDELSIDDIKGMFGEEKDLPEPDIIKLDTDTESIVRKKGKGIAQGADTTVVKKAYYGPTPTMSSSCPKCQSKMMIDWEKARKDGKTVTKCAVCGYEELYEGSLENQGVAGQKDN